jgi:hypothetical protein
MSDNLSAKPLAADNIATDYVGGAHHVRVKVQYGDDNTATDVSTTAPLPVTLGSGTAAARIPAIPHTLTGTSSLSSADAPSTASGRSSSAP